MKHPEVRPAYKVKDTHHASRIVSPEERALIDKASYSGGSVPPAMVEHLPRPPKKK